MNPTLRIGKVIRTLALMGIMLALAGFMVHAPSASAGRNVPTDGTVAVYPIFPSEKLTTAAVMIYDSEGNPFAKGTATSDESFVATLTPGGYTVRVFADGYTDYNETIKVSGGQNITIKAPLNSATPDPMIADGDVVVHVIFPSNTGDATAQVYIRDRNGIAHAKGTATSDSNFTANLAPGLYKVSLYTAGYNDYNEIIEVTSADTTTVKAALTPVNARMRAGK